jgi:hypothetical protein
MDLVWVQDKLQGSCQIEIRLGFRQLYLVNKVGLDLICGKSLP